MSYQYEVTVDEHLFEAFRTMATHVLKLQGFRTGLHVASLGGTGVAEYHRNDDLVTFSTTEEAHGRRHLMLSSETVEVVPLVMSAVEQLAIDVTASFWAPVTGVSRENLVRDLHRAITRVLKQAAKGSDSASA